MIEFVPVNFQDQYFSILNCYMQSVLLDFRFRVDANTNNTTEDSNETVAHYFFADDYG